MMAGALIATGAFGSALAQQQVFDGYYRGSWECEQNGIGILHTQLRLFVRNGKIGMGLASRFDVDGRATKLSPEGAMGVVGPDGAFSLGTSMFDSHEGTVYSTYTGKFTGTGGTMTGTQVWTRVPTGRNSVSRTCNGTFVKVDPPVKLFDGIYKGSWECEQSGLGMLRTSLLLNVQEGGVFALASLFDIDGREMSEREAAMDVNGDIRFALDAAGGIVDAHGAFRLAGTLDTGNATFHSTYTGRFSGAGGTMTGTQVWRRASGGDSVSRTCNGTFVKVEQQ
jgi:hypothetical protein